MVAPALSLFVDRGNQRKVCHELNGEHGPANHDQEAPHCQHDKGEPPKFPNHLFFLFVLVTVITHEGSHALGSDGYSKGRAFFPINLPDEILWRIILIIQAVISLHVFQCRRVPEM